MAEIIRTENLQYAYPADEGAEPVLALKGVDLTIEQGSFVVVLGHNGSGKSTLAKIIAGIYTPTSGRILLDGEDITGLDITQRAHRGVSFAFQQPVRFKGLTVKDLITLASGQNIGVPEACNYLSEVGLCAKDYIDREVDASLSGGEVKRIEIATILARKSGLMIFDEPEAGIDLWSFAKLTETFRAIHQKREATLIVISHQERIIDLADEIVMIRDGKIAKHGPKDEIFPQILANTSAGCSYMSEGAR